MRRAGAAHQFAVLNASQRVSPPFLLYTANTKPQLPETLLVKIKVNRDVPPRGSFVRACKEDAHGPQGLPHGSRTTKEDSNTHSRRPCPGTHVSQGCGQLGVGSQGTQRCMLHAPLGAYAPKHVLKHSGKVWTACSDACLQLGQSLRGGTLPRSCPFSKAMGETLFVPAVFCGIFTFPLLCVVIITVRVNETCSCRRHIHRCAP